MERNRVKTPAIQATGPATALGDAIPGRAVVTGRPWLSTVTVDWGGGVVVGGRDVVLGDVVGVARALYLAQNVVRGVSTAQRKRVSTCGTMRDTRLSRLTRVTGRIVRLQRAHAGPRVGIKGGRVRFALEAEARVSTAARQHTRHCLGVTAAGRTSSRTRPRRPARSRSRGSSWSTR